VAEPCAVLLVEDDDHIREVFAELLSSEGFAVRTAANGREALDILDEWRPNLILLDLDMPEMNGREFRAEQRRNPQLAPIPVIVLSAGVLAASVEDLQAAEFMAKPCDIDALVAAIRRATDG
jgi:CheY-like chemotaxis protein